MLINVDKYRAAVPSTLSPPLPPSHLLGREKRDVQLHLPSHEVHNDADICQKARNGAGENVAAATMLATAISRAALF